MAKSKHAKESGAPSPTQESPQEGPCAAPALLLITDTEPSATGKSGSPQEAMVSIPSHAELSALLRDALSRIAELEAEVRSTKHLQASQPARPTGNNAASPAKPQPPVTAQGALVSTAQMQDPARPSVTGAPLPQAPLSQPFLQQPTPLAPLNLAPAYQPIGPVATPPFPSGRDEIPLFYGEIPASLSLQQNREVESWIASIKLLTLPSTDDAFI